MCFIAFAQIHFDTPKDRFTLHLGKITEFEQTNWAPTVRKIVGEKSESTNSNRIFLPTNRYEVVFCTTCYYGISYVKFTLI